MTGARHSDGVQDPFRRALLSSRTYQFAISIIEHGSDRGLSLEAEGSLLERVGDASILGRAYDGSTLHHLLTQGGSSNRGSWLYQWLTSEPEPDVIVIDLRKTRTIGPFLDILDRAFNTLERKTSSSTSVHLGDRFAASPVRFMSVLLCCFILASLILRWPLANPLILAAHCIAFIAAVIGVVADSSDAAVSDSRIIAILVDVLSPPEVDSVNERE